MAKHALVVIFLIAALASAARADGVRFWKIDGRKDFLGGETEGVSILADESLSLAPELKRFTEPGVPFIWSIAPDGKGGAYLGTGHEGLVLRVNVNGDTSVVYDALEPEVMALAVAPNGDLFVGASPEGRVYRIPGGTGQAEVYFDPEEKYIWKILPGPAGELFVAVGFKGKVYKVTGSHRGSLILDSDENHIISLALDRKGNLLAGSSGSALLYQIDADGGVSIVYDSPLNDMRSIVVDSDNNLFVVAFEIKSGNGQGQNMFSQPSDTDGQTGKNNQEQEGQELKRGMILRPPSVRMAPPTNSEIYYFDQDRFVTRIWRESGDAIMALGLSEDNQALFVASKDKRSLYKIDRRGELTLINKFGSSEATGFLYTGGRTLIITGNPGQVHSLEKGYSLKGTFTSDVLPAGIPAQWGRLTWMGEVPSGTKLSFRTRSGNTDKPDTTWSPWSSPMHGVAEELISSPARRNFQWRVEMETDNPSRTPLLREVTVSYLRRNRPPMISPVRFMPQGLYIKQNGAPLAEGGSAKKYPQEVAQLMKGASNDTDKPFQGKKEYDRRFRMAGWNANDANGDQLRYSIYYRGIDESSWRTLREKSKTNTVIFDTENIADGRYLLKVVAFDSLDNPADRALCSERLSAPFFVDNTAPVIRDLVVDSQADGAVVVSFRVEDTTTRIERVELTLDSGDARPMSPSDDLLDTTKESFRVELAKPGKGEHTVSVQAWDRFFNRTTARNTFQVD
ncbi:MAG: hypothetical protein FVQ81_01640 [Candidatus Glassbacteria bacterium]|nr:hypothetical protein [Candidatus Glassbacteria bacterium]